MGKIKHTKYDKSKITLSNIAKELEETSGVSSRTIERKFVTLLEKLNQDKEEYKDENGYYTFDSRIKSGIAAMLMESARKDSMFDKVLRDKSGEIEQQDVIDYFLQIVEGTSEEMDENIRANFLAQQDENVGYSLFAALYNITNTLSALVLNIQTLPYLYQVEILNSLYENVFEEYLTDVRRSIADTLIQYFEFKKLDKSLELDGLSDDRDDFNSNIKGYYDSLDKSYRDLLRKDSELKAKVEEAIQHSVDDL